MRHSSFLLHPLFVQPIFNDRYNIQNFFVLWFFLVTHTLKQDGLASAFSITSLTELKQNRSILTEYDRSLFAAIRSIYILFPWIKHPKR